MAVKVGERLNYNTVHQIVNGVPLHFTRRRYGTTTYTWVDSFTDGEWRSVGDPWPSVRPPKKDLEALFPAKVEA